MIRVDFQCGFSLEIIFWVDGIKYFARAACFGQGSERWSVLHGHPKMPGIGGVIVFWKSHPLLYFVSSLDLPIVGHHGFCYWLLLSGRMSRIKKITFKIGVLFFKFYFLSGWLCKNPFIVVYKFTIWLRLGAYKNHKILYFKLARVVCSGVFSPDLF